MKVAVFIATSADGMITRGSSDSDWVNDWTTFTNKIKEYGCVLMGRKTYEASLDVFPFPTSKNYVLTSNSSLLSSDSFFINNTPSKVLDTISEQGNEQVLLIGGQSTITQFVQQNLVDEVYIDVHPLLIGFGKQILSEAVDLDLSLVGTFTSEKGIVTLHYKVNKK